ncbi:MAG: type II secretion system F family protein [Acidobacteriota bacterium]|nr:type II secretion system F family protein [Acidobacteriota bacterium]
MPGLLVIVFLVIFALVLVAVGLGFSYLESSRKKRVRGMLQGVVEQEEVASTFALMKPPAAEDPIAKLLERFDFTKRVRIRLEQAGLEWTVGRLFLTMGITAAIGLAIGLKVRVLVLPSLSAVALAILFGTLPYFYVSRKRRQRMARFEEQFPEALDFLARSMRAGHAFSISMELLAADAPDPLAIEFRKVSNQQQLGSAMHAALENLIVAVPLIDVRFFVSSVMMQQETGGNLGEILSKLSYVIRERFRLKGQVKAASAHGRITGMVLTLMPLALIVVLTVIAPEYLGALLTDNDGKYMILGSIIGQLLGFYFIRKIINIKV